MCPICLNLNDFQSDQNSKSKPFLLNRGVAKANESHKLFNSNKSIIDSILWLRLGGESVGTSFEHKRLST